MFLAAKNRLPSSGYAFGFDQTRRSSNFAGHVNRVACREPQGQTIRIGKIVGGGGCWRLVICREYINWRGPPEADKHLQGAEVFVLYPKAPSV
jgi:hypothetical protein